MTSRTDMANRFDSDASDEEFIRHWSERVYDTAQLIAIATLERQMIDYARTAWRNMDIPPPTGVVLITAVEEGLALMVLNPNGDWRTTLGQPHKPPRAWMPAPIPPTIPPRAVA